MSQPIILLAGATGDLGSRIVKSLLDRGALVRALLRQDAKPSDQAALQSQGVTVLMTNDADASSMTAACQDAACVISALNGLHAVIVDRQTVLLDAAMVC